MPIINVTVTGKADPALSQRIAATVSELTAKHLHKDPTITAIVVNYVDPVHWFAGGRSLADQGANSFWLDIKVVDGTNTKQEMASYRGRLCRLPKPARQCAFGKLHPRARSLRRRLRLRRQDTGVSLHQQQAQGCGLSTDAHGWAKIRCGAGSDRRRNSTEPDQPGFASSLPRSR